jgi:membrane protein implicated in regulation of membrane protease activity
MCAVLVDATDGTLLWFGQVMVHVVGWNSTVWHRYLSRLRWYWSLVLVVVLSAALSAMALPSDIWRFLYSCVRRDDNHNPFEMLAFSAIVAIDGSVAF